MTRRRMKQAFLAVLIAYLILALIQGFLFFGSATLWGKTLGIAFMTIPLIAMWFIWREMVFRWQIKDLANEIDRTGGFGDLPGDGGEATAPDPADWRAWYALGASYEAAGDRRRAKGALRHALEVHSSGQL